MYNAMMVDRPLSEMLQIKTTASEKTAVERAAELIGISLSAYVRMRLRECVTEDLAHFGERP